MNFSYDLVWKKSLNCDLTALEKYLSLKTHFQLSGLYLRKRMSQTIEDHLDTLVHGGESEGNCYWYLFTREKML